MNIEQINQLQDGDSVRCRGTVNQDSAARNMGPSNYGDGDWYTLGFLLNLDSGGSIWVNCNSPRVQHLPAGAEVELRHEDGKGARISTYEKDGEERRSIKVSGGYLSVLSGGTQSSAASGQVKNGKLTITDYRAALAEAMTYWKQKGHSEDIAERLAVSELIARAKGQVVANTEARPEPSPPEVYSPPPPDAVAADDDIPF